ncbi:MAG: diphosphomevalonate decarboxylase [Candidatus Pacebacteria bacterium]|jgi:diphosphomevalonate decarboxylase|nr:diphosphomevalonate decarboxylase [Candidatus Paceibacterota bacterium]
MANTKMKATAIAHPMQGLLKYHGLKDKTLRLPFHDSISVTVDALYTKTTVEFGDFEKDEIRMNGEDLQEGERAFERCLVIIDRVRELANLTKKCKIESQNSLSYDEAKGLGFSSSGGAALAGAAFKAAKLDKKYGWDLKMISKIARRLAGSAARSVAGEYARWYAGSDDESSYAEKIATKTNLDMGILIVPITSDVKTEDAHEDVLTSPFFKARLKSVNIRIEEMEEAIKSGDLEKTAQLIETDALELHALTMTGKHGILIFQPESIQVISEVRKMRKEGVPVWFSMQTGPSVFINTYPNLVPKIQKRIEALGLRTIPTSVGKEVQIRE